MPERVPQSKTLRVPLKAFLSSDHVSTATGKTVAVTLSKNMAAFGNPSAGATNATELSAGWYYVDLSATDTGTAGPLVVRGTSSGVDDVEAVYDVVDARNAGLDALPAVASGSAGAVPTTGTGANQIAVDGAGNAKADVNKWLAGAIPAANVTGVPLVDAKYVLGTAVTEGGAGRLAGAFTAFFDVASPALTTASANQTGDAFARVGAAGAGLTALGDARLANLDAAVTSRLAPTTAGRTLDVSAGGEAGVDWANVGGAASTVALTGTTVGTATTLTNAPPDGAGVTTLLGRLTAGRATGLDNLDAAVSTRSTYAGADTAGTTTLLARLTAGRSANLDNLDAAVGTRLASASYTAPDNATVALIYGVVDTEVAAIKARTDALPAQPAAVGSAMTLAGGAITDATFTVPAEAAGSPAGFMARLMWLCARLGLRRVRRTPAAVETYLADGATVATTQAYTSGTTDDVSGAV
jgi:hypothetical protein